MGVEDAETPSRASIPPRTETKGSARYPIWDCGLTKNCGQVRDMVDF